MARVPVLKSPDELTGEARSPHRLLKYLNGLRIGAGELVAGFGPICSANALQSDGFRRHGCVSVPRSHGRG